jgi:hypothetical protein
MVRLWWRPVLLVALACGLFGACSSGQSGGTPAASCAAVIVHDGHTYWGTAPVKRDPDTTGRLVNGVRPACDDTSGQETAGPAEHVKVAELAGVPITTAFLWHTTVFVRRGSDLPAGTRPWFHAPRCRSAGDFNMTADWLGVTAPHKPRFDGDIRLPYRLELHVVDGPSPYVGATLQVHADRATDPALGPRDVTTSLWHGGQVAARVDCVDGRFHVLSLRVPHTK